MLPIFKIKKTRRAFEDQLKNGILEKGIELYICSSTVDTNEFLKCISHLLFQNSLPENMIKNMNTHLLQLIGKKPPQFMNEQYICKNSQ